MLISFLIQASGPISKIHLLLDDDALFKEVVGFFGSFCSLLLDILLSLLRFILDAEGVSCWFWQYMLIVITNKTKGQGLQYLTHIVELIYLFLAACDNNMPQCGFDNIESAHVAFLQTVLLIEPPPTLHKQEATILAWETAHLPTSRTVHWSLEHDHARFLQSNCMAESCCQRLQ